MREDVAELLKRLEDTQKGETICLKYDDVRNVLNLLRDHGKTEITGNTLDTETILDGLDHMTVACEGLSCDECRFRNKKAGSPCSCNMDEGSIAENAARLIEDQAERIAIMSEGGWHKATELPKETGDYIVTIIEMERLKSVTTRNYRISFGWGLFSNEKLVCWMPLPEPPKEGEA